MKTACPRDSKEADLLLRDLQAVLRCRCCPDGLFTGMFGAQQAPSARNPARPLTREDFIGLLERHELDGDAR
jgi:hypothetical protein